MCNNIDEEVDYGFSDSFFKQMESWHDMHIDSDIHGNDRSKILCMLEAYSDIITDIPGFTNFTQHVITLSDNKPIAVHQYNLPLTKMQLKLNEHNMGIV